MSSVVISGDTSGAVTLSAPAVAGTVTVTLPSTSGVMAVGGGTITTLTTTSDITVQGVTVGRGAGAVATNTAVGASALAATASGGDNTGAGYIALTALTSGTENSAFGSSTLKSNTSGADNSAFGYGALFSNTTASNNSGFGVRALLSNTTGASNTAVGMDSLRSNTTASNNTAVGYQAGYTSTGYGQTFIGYRAGYTSNPSSTTIGYNTGVGHQSLFLLTTGIENVAVGDASGYNLTTGTYNSFFGPGAGFYVTSGGKNTIIGGYSGNQGGLDIRTASNYIVLSDGDGNPRLTSNGSGEWAMGENPIAGYRLAVKSGDATASTYAVLMRNSASTNLLAIRSDGYFSTGTAANSPYNSTTGSAANVFVDSGGQLSRSTSSLKYKTDVQDATHGLAEVMTLRPVTYKGKRDGDRIFGGLIAEEVHTAGLTEFVQYSDDGSPDALAYGNMVSLCIKAIQELKAEVNSLKAQINGASA